MFSLLGEDDLVLFCAAGGGKNGEVLDNALRAGDNIGGLLDGIEGASARIQGPLVRLSDTADSTGDVACGDSTCCWSCCSFA